MTTHAIYSLLSNDPNVTALTGTRIYPETAEQGVQVPYIVFSKITAIPSDTKQAPSKMDEERWQIDNYDTNFDNCEALAGHIRRALDYKSGTIAGVSIKQIRFANDNGSFDNNALSYRRSADYTIRKNRS